MSRRPNSKLQTLSADQLRELLAACDGDLSELRRALNNAGLTESMTEELLHLASLVNRPKSKPSKRLTLQNWTLRFVDLFDIIEEEFHDEAAIFHATFDKVYESGEIHGTCETDEGTFDVFVRADFESPPGGCSCVESRGEEPCIHLAFFLSELIFELQSRQSPLRKRIDKQKFDRGPIDRSRFEGTSSLSALAKLDELVDARRLKEDAEPVQEDSIASRAQAFPDRLAWRLAINRGSFEIYPVVQTANKRRTAYTKGRRRGLGSLLADRSIACSTIDQRALAQVTYEYDYRVYREAPVLKPIATAEALVGADNVFIDKTPVSISRDSLAIVVKEIDGAYYLGFVLASDDAETRDLLLQNQFRSLIASRDEMGASAAGRREELDRIEGTAHLTVFDDEHTVVRWDEMFNRLAVIRVDSFEQELLRALITLPGVPIDQGKELAERLLKLQRHFTIHMPESLSGRTVPVQSRDVVLLRSNADATFDVVLRVRDHRGNLRRVGATPAVTTGEVDGEPVLFERDIADEIRRADLLATTLKMAPENTIEDESYSRHITDFGEALELVDHLQQSSQDELGDADHVETSGCDETPEILWDRNSEKPFSVLGQINSSNLRVEIKRKRDWFGISGQCEVGGKKIPLAQLLDQFGVDQVDRVHGDFVRLKDGQWARISKRLRNRLRRLRDATHQDRKSLKLDGTSAPAIRDVFADGHIELKAVKAWQTCLDRLADAEKLQPLVPERLDASLRDYQVDGFSWLRRLAEWGVGGVLADDMGLGKTLQTLAVLLDRRSAGPALVIAPTSVGFNWMRETERFTPDLDAYLYRETERREFLKSVGPGDLVVCSYGLALRDTEALAAVDWGTLVLDEAQAIKNARSKTSIAIAEIPAQWKVALTGTPVENHLGELWSLFHVVSPGVLGGWEAFRKRYAAPIEKHNDAEARAALAERLQPFVLRRKKSEVLTELPPRTEMNLYVDLSPQERSRYEQVRLEAIGEVDDIEKSVNTPDQRFRILALLTRLRQISCHPGLVDKTYDGTSAKLQCLIETLADLRSEGHRALIFSQFTEHLGLIRTAIEEAGFSYEYLDGSTPAKTRQQRVDAFQQGNSDVFLISLKAGGTGLNLTAADYVIHMDPWWNPAVEDQATDRAHRMGQENPVMVYRIVAKSTIEEEILALHESKRDLVAGVMEGTAAAGKLSNEELIEMLRKP